MAKTPAKNIKAAPKASKDAKAAKGPKGANGPKGPNGAKKKMSKGVRALLLLFGLGIVTIVVAFVVQKVGQELDQSKTVVAVVDMEFGMGGEGPGHFREPQDVAAAPDGDFYVSDFSGHNIQKFDRNGAPQGTIGQEGKEEGKFEQPSGLFVDAQDHLYVCDTFNHRIQKFDSKGQLEKVFTHGFFGPRSIVGNGLGRLYVSDTGNHKIQVFDQNGNFIKEFGGFGTTDGKFREPVGLAADDKNNIYVADSDNERIQKFDPEGKFMGAFKISTWKGKNDEVPYLSYGDGALWASSTSRNAVLKLDPNNGKLLAICVRKEKEGFTGAAGVAYAGDGHVLVVEKGKDQVARFSIPAAPVH